MESNDKTKLIIKNRSFSYFDDIIKFEGFDLNNVLIGEKSYRNILVYKNSYKTLMGARLLHIVIDRFIGVYDGSKYLVSFGGEKYDLIYNRIRYLIGVKSSIEYVFCHNSARIKVNSFDCLPLEKTMTFHNVIMFIQSVFNKDKNNNYYIIF